MTTSLPATVFSSSSVSLAAQAYGFATHASHKKTQCFEGVEKHISYLKLIQYVVPVSVIAYYGL
jgi:hypothetical protein